MAVYKHQYRRYEGELTAHWQRLLVIPRYSYRTVFQSRFFIIFFVSCLLVPIGAAVLIYLRHNLSALEMLQIPLEAFVPIDARFFKALLSIQGVFAFLLTVFVGPGLVSPDLTNNALPLYLSRPFSKVDYVVGKTSVLLILQSCVTWIPLSILYLLQSILQGGDWGFDNARIFVAILAGALIWIVFLAVLALAISAWVRWRAVAGALLFGVFFVGAGFGEAIKEIFVTPWGGLFKLTEVIEVVWSALFYGSGGASVQRIGGAEVEGITIWSAILVLAGVGAICLLLLRRRIRAYEIVR